MVPSTQFDCRKLLFFVEVVVRFVLSWWSLQYVLVLYRFKILFDQKSMNPLLVIVEAVVRHFN